MGMTKEVAFLLSQIESTVSTNNRMRRNFSNTMHKFIDDENCIIHLKEDIVMSCILDMDDLGFGLIYVIVINENIDQLNIIERDNEFSYVVVTAEGFIVAKDRQ